MKNNTAYQSTYLFVRVLVEVWLLSPPSSSCHSRTTCLGTRRHFCFLHSDPKCWTTSVETTQVARNLRSNSKNLCAAESKKKRNDILIKMFINISHLYKRRKLSLRLFYHMRTLTYIRRIILLSSKNRTLKSVEIPKNPSLIGLRKWVRMVIFTCMLGLQPGYHCRASS